MLIDFSVENFLSIDKKVVLSLDSGSGKKLPENLIELDSKNRLLKSAAIYGANASGKSNLIKAVQFVGDMVVRSASFNVETKIQRTPFKLSEDSIKNPSKFEVNFIRKGITYVYGFSCDEEKIHEEYLYYWPHGRKKVIFERKRTNRYRFTDDEEQQKLLSKQTIQNTLYVSRATQLGFEKTREAYEFFAKNLVLVDSSDLLLGNNSPWIFGKNRVVGQKLSENPKLKDRVLEILQRADFGGIVDIKVKKERRLTKLVGDITSADFEDFYDITFIHKKRLKNTETVDVEFDIEEESDGTKRTLELLGVFFDVLDNGQVVVIDELEQSLHPDITKFLVRLFHSKHNKNNAQLIFTTQSTNLLDNKLFRKDQLYFCTKEPNRNTELVSLIEYDLRQDADFEKAYLGGRLGGVPLIDETLFD